MAYPQLPQEWSEWSDWLSAGLHGRCRWHLPPKILALLHRLMRLAV